MNPKGAIHIVISENVPPTWGGVARVAYNVCVALSDAGLTTVLCGFDKYVSDPMYKEQKFSTHAIPSRGWKWGKHLTMMRLMLELKAQYEGRPVVLYALTWKLARRARLISKRLGWRVVIFAHGLEVTKQLVGGTNANMLKVLNSADLCLGVSQYTADVLCQIGIPPAKVKVLNNSVDVEEFFPVRDTEERDQVRALREKIVSENGVIILTLARVRERKGQDSVIKALAQLSAGLPADSPPVRYVIAGRGPDEEVKRLKDLAAELGVSDSVIIWGYVAAEDMRVFYNACDIYVMNSRIVDASKDVEGFGITFLEASACAKPVIGGRSGGVVDAVADGVSGYLVDPEDIPQLSEKLLALVTDAELRQTMGQQGLQRVKQTFTVDAIGQRLIFLLEQLP